MSEGSLRHMKVHSEELSVVASWFRWASWKYLTEKKMHLKNRAMYASVIPGLGGRGREPEGRP